MDPCTGNPGPSCEPAPPPPDPTIEGMRLSTLDQRISSIVHQGISCLSRGGGGGGSSTGGTVTLPAIWTNEVQVTNACINALGVSNLSELAQYVCDNTPSPECPPCPTPQSFSRNTDNQLTQITWGAPVERVTALTYNASGQLTQTVDTWSASGIAYTRTTAFTYDTNGFVTNKAATVTTVP